MQSANSGTLVERYVAALAGVNSPERFRRWAGIGLVAAALGRRVWTEVVRGRPIFPNLYTLLVGPPGTGKNEAIMPAKGVMGAATTERMSPNAITAQKLVEWLGEAPPEVIDGMVVKNCAVSAFVAEWAVLMRNSANTDMMGCFADLYDNPDVYDASTISRGADHLENVCVNIMAGVTPAWFADGFPVNAFEQGLPARLHLIWGEPSGRPPALFEEAIPLDTSPLLPDVRRLQQLTGMIEWAPEAKAAFKNWVDNGMVPVLQEPMLQSYNNRRLVHTAKLALIAAVSRSPTVHPTITLADLETAWEWMFDAEPHMPRALVAAGGNTYRMREEALANFVRDRYKITGKHVNEWEARQRLGRMVPAAMVGPIVDELLASKVLEASNPEARSPNRLLRPGPGMKEKQ